MGSALGFREGAMEHPCRRYEVYTGGAPEFECPSWENLPAQNHEDDGEAFLE